MAVKYYRRFSLGRWAVRSSNLSYRVYTVVRSADLRSLPKLPMAAVVRKVLGTRWYEWQLRVLQVPGTKRHPMITPMDRGELMQLTWPIIILLL